MVKTTMADKKKVKGKGKETEQNQEQSGDIPVPRLETTYKETVVPALIDRFRYKNKMMVPKLSKISINIGVGEAVAEPKLLETAIQELGQITGQKPQIRKSRKAISNFKLREGQAIGCRVTLRKKYMYEFLERFVT